MTVTLEQKLMSRTIIMMKKNELEKKKNKKSRKKSARIVPTRVMVSRNGNKNISINQNYLTFVTNEKNEQKLYM